MATKKKPVGVAPTEVIEATTPVVEAYLQAGVPPYEENPKPGWDTVIAEVTPPTEGLPPPPPFIKISEDAANGVPEWPLPPTAPGETGSAPLTRPTQRNESKWQQ